MSGGAAVTGRRSAKGDHPSWQSRRSSGGGGRRTGKRPAALTPALTARGPQAPDKKQDQRAAKGPLDASQRAAREPCAMGSSPGCSPPRRRMSRPHEGRDGRGQNDGGDHESADANRAFAHDTDRADGAAAPAFDRAAGIARRLSRAARYAREPAEHPQGAGEAEPSAAEALTQARRRDCSRRPSARPIGDAAPFHVIKEVVSSGL
jgi:hypothetical protein